MSKELIDPVSGKLSDPEKVPKPFFKVAPPPIVQYVKVEWLIFQIDRLETEIKQIKDDTTKLRADFLKKYNKFILNAKFRRRRTRLRIFDAWQFI